MVAEFPRGFRTGKTPRSSEVWRQHGARQPERLQRAGPSAALHHPDGWRFIGRLDGDPAEKVTGRNGVKKHVELPSGHIWWNVAIQMDFLTFWRLDVVENMPVVVTML